MALLFCDSFDHYSSGQGSRKWTTYSGASSIVPGRTGNGITGGALDFPSKTFNAEYSTLTMGVAYKTPAFANAPVKFGNAVYVSPNDLHFQFGHVGDGRLKFIFQFGATAESPPTTWVMQTDRWYYIEVKCALTGGPPAHIVASARINGAEVLAWDYTHSSGNAALKWADASMSGVGGGYSSIMDDVYVTDGEFLGDVRIGVLYPNAAGDSAGWTPTPAGNNWQQVKEHPADDDATYVSTPTVSAKDLYHLDDIDPAFTGVIKGVQALWCVKKSDEGVGAVKGVWKSGATEIVQAAGHNYLAPDGFHPSATNYLYDIQTERKSLFTAADWTVAEINALQLGIIRTL
jgi:hypothetical protein